MYLKQLTIYHQMKQHLISLGIYITMHWPKFIIYINDYIQHLCKRNELVTKCRHENKFYLANYKDIPP